jgi:hypothetical protein
MIFWKRLKVASGPMPPKTPIILSIIDIPLSLFGCKVQHENISNHGIFQLFYLVALALLLEF